MGKSEAARAGARRGVPVFEADRVGHGLLDRDGPAVTAVAAVFPDVVDGGGINRALLGDRVFGDATALAALEQVLHPLVRRAERRFLTMARRRAAALVVLDIPLLFETASERRCDLTVVVTAPAFVQRARVRRRPGMSEARYRMILAQQMPDDEKRRRASFVIPTGAGRRFSLRRIERIVTMLSRAGGSGASALRRGRCGQGRCLLGREVYDA